MAKIIKKKIKGQIYYTLCEHFKDLPERLRPALSFTCPYCPVCGQTLIHKGWVMKDICSKCGKPVADIGKLATNYCAFCGEKFEEKIETAYIKQPATGSGLV